MGKKKNRSRLRKLQILLKKGKINHVLWLVHFGNVPSNIVPMCKDCFDFQMGECSGGYDPIECFIEASKHDTVESFGKIDELR